MAIGAGGACRTFAPAPIPKRFAYKIRLTSEQEDDLHRFARSRTLAARLVERAKMLVLGSTGHTVEEIAEQLGVSRQTVARWLGCLPRKRAFFALALSSSTFGLES